MPDEGQALLSLLQLSDSALPIGGFSHSWGLETWVARGVVDSPKSAESAVRTLVEFTAAPFDGAACAIAHRLSCRDDERGFIELNRLLDAGRWCAEPARASTALGDRLRRLALEAGLIGSFPDCRAHHGAVFGWLTGKLCIDRSQAASAYLFSAAASLISACVRLVPLGHTDGQAILARMKPKITELADACVTAALEDIQSFAPLNEWACREHETLHTRLFQS